MSNTSGERWKQRLENFGKILSRLKEACDIEKPSQMEITALVKRFEMSFELGWKTLKDLLFYEGFDFIKSPRGVIRESFKAGYITEDECEVFFDLLDKRNLLAHVYDEKKALEAERLIKAKYYPLLLNLHKAMSKRIEK